MSTDKEQKAFRVMEALSAADEELLERCERSGAPAEKGKKGNRGKIYLFVRRHGRSCAACLCLLLIGAAYFGLTRTRGQNFGDNGGSSDNMMSPENALQEQEAEYADGGIELSAEGGYKADEPMEEAAGEACPSEAPEWLDIDQLAGASAVTVQNQYTTERAEEDRADDDLRDSSGSTPVYQQKKMTETAERIASEARVPEDYARVSEDYSSVKQDEEVSGEEQSAPDGFLLEWSDGVHTLWLKMTQTELTADMRFDTVPPVYTVREEWRDLIPQADEEGLVQFALLREDGVLVEYRGVLDREEIIALLESVLTAE